MIKLRPYRSTDATEAFELWCASLAVHWPLDRNDFTARLQTGLVALDADKVVGLCVFSRSGLCAALQLLVVHPGSRRSGIGTALHSACLAELVASGVTRLSLGGSPGPSFWPGLPDLGCDATAESFLAERGWSFDGACFDLTGDSGGFEAAAEPTDRIDPSVSYRVVGAADKLAVAEFEQRHFPDWAAYFELPQQQVMALDRGRIVGSLLTGGQDGLLWRELLGPQCCSIGCVGVAPQAEGRGIGTGMVGFAMKELRAGGAGTCYLAWVYRVSFYGRLGFRPWRRYQTASLKL